MRIVKNQVHYLFSENIPKHNKNSTPERRPEKRQRPKWFEWHAENTSWNRDEMTHHGDESTKKSVQLIILEKESFRTMIFFVSDKEIFSVFFEKRFPYPSPKDEIVNSRSENGTGSTSENGKNWIKFALGNEPSSRYHHEF